MPKENNFPKIDGVETVMGEVIRDEGLEKWCAANLNDGEYPIPEEGRMVELGYAVEVIGEYVASQREEWVRKIEELKNEYTDMTNSVPFKDRVPHIICLKCLEDVLKLIK